ncbi:MAG: Bug family tripartite tricarboxylate transporter substrate binding protein [bacterium]
MRREFAALAIALGTASCTLQAHAQAYPARPVRIIVPFAPGGSTDIVARLIARGLSEAWRQQVVVENRPGAGGTIGVDHVARSAPDGHTLVFGHVGTFGFGPSLYSKLPYDAVKDFAPIGLFTAVPNMLAVHPSLPARSVKELVALARARPGALNYASSGNGSASHLAVEYFKLLTKTDIVAIAYRGTGPMLVDMIAGHTLFTITGVPPLAPFVDAGKLRAIGVGSAKRLPLYPKLPTVAESGYPEYEVTTWYGLLAPAKTPRETILQINGELLRMLARPEVRDVLAQQAAEPLGSTPEEFGAHIQREIARWARVIKAAGVTVE